MPVLEGFKKKRVVFMNDTIKTFHQKYDTCLPIKR